MNARLFGASTTLLAILSTACASLGVEVSDAGPPDKASGPCLPLHTIEGMSGHFSVPSAYPVNPAAEGEVMGMPSIGTTHVHLGHGKHLEAFTITETLWDRVEIGYGFNLLDVGDVYEDMGTATGIRPHGDSIRLHNLNVRVVGVKEGDFGASWMPAITAGVHFKHNQDLNDLDNEFAALGGLRAIADIRDDSGLDFTLFASKMLTFLPRPAIVTAGIRSTESAHLGLLGFTGDRTIVAEAAACYLLTDSIVLAGEYRQKPNEYKVVPGLIEGEDDWWVLAAAYLPTNQLSVAVGYGHFGTLLNHKANASWGIAIKYEF